MANANNTNIACTPGNNPANNPNNSPDRSMITDNCCVGQSGCFWDGNLDSVVLEPIYVQKVYDSALFNLQGISYSPKQTFEPELPEGSTVVKLNYINITKYFDPTNGTDPDNFCIIPKTTLQGAQFVKYVNESGELVEDIVVGPDGRKSEKIVYVDTACCDARGRGTPIFGSQNITLCGQVRIDLGIEYIDPNRGNCPIPQQVTGYFTLVTPGSIEPGITLTNFFELCVPSIYEGAFFPRFTELCNASLTGRLMTNNIGRDIIVEDGVVKADILISICVTCEKKIVVPVQLCVLSNNIKIQV